MNPIEDTEETQVKEHMHTRRFSIHDSEIYETNWMKPALGPHSEDLNAKRIAFHAGPCWLKILVADRVAGSIIGKGGKVITEIETTTGCIMKLSPGMWRSVCL